MKHDYLDTSINSQIVKLEKPLPDILRDTRKGHNYDIDKSKKILECAVLEKVTHSQFGEYQELHRIDAGRVTRDQKTFNIQEKWINDGTGILVAARYKGQTAGFAYVNIYKKGAYYMSACSLPELKSELPIGHGITWKVIEWLSENCYGTYEIGWQVYGPQIADRPTIKEIEISHFKRGFGGTTVPLFRGERFYNRDVMSTTLKDRVESFLNL